MNSNEILETVYRYPHFTQAEWQQIMAAHEEVFWPKNSFLLQEGKPANEYFIICEGLARSFVYDYNGNDITTLFIGISEIAIDVNALFKRIPARENIMAVTDCKCWKIHFDHFQELFHSLAGFREWGRQWMAEQLFLCKQRSVEMITVSATQRYLNLLAEKPMVIQLAPLKQIATYLGVTDTSLSRIRKELSHK